MRCAACGERTRVIDTDTFDGVVVRVRKCIACGLAVTTDESPRIPKVELKQSGVPALVWPERPQPKKGGRK